MQPADYSGSCDLAKNEILGEYAYDEQYRGHDGCWNIANDGHDGIEVKYHKNCREKIGQKPVVPSNSNTMGTR